MKSLLKDILFLAIIAHQVQTVTIIGRNIKGLFFGRRLKSIYHC